MSQKDRYALTLLLRLANEYYTAAKQNKTIHFSKAGTSLENLPKGEVIGAPGRGVTLVFGMALQSPVRGASEVPGATPYFSLSHYVQLHERSSTKAFRNIFVLTVLSTSGPCR